jgi:hypothetical protein
VWQRRAQEAEARHQAEVRELQGRMKRLCDAIDHCASVVEGSQNPSSSTARRAVASPQTPVEMMMENQGGTAKQQPIHVIDISSSSDDEDDGREEAPDPVIVPSKSKLL